MQTVTFDITAKPPASLVLWRAIPATVTLTNLGDTSGDWKCIVTAGTWDDATLLTGEVAAGTAPGALTVTFAAMDSEPLAAAIKGSATLSCVATLTDSVSRVLLIPLCIRNRATDVQPPPPPSQTYVNSINGETGDVTLGASDVGALPADTTADDIGALPAPAEAGTPGQVYTKTAAGEAWEDLPATDWSKAVTASGAAITPEAGGVYAHTLAAGDVLTIDTSGLGSRQADFELHLTQPSAAVAVTLPAGIKWEADGVFSAENDAPDLSTGGQCYILTFRWTGSFLLGNLAGAEVL